MINQAGFLECFKQELAKDPALKENTDYKEMMADLCSSAADPLKDKLTLTDQFEMMLRFSESTREISSQDKEINTVMIMAEYLGGDEWEELTVEKLRYSAAIHEGKRLSALLAFVKVIEQQLADPGQEPCAPEIRAKVLNLILSPRL
jgi:hypothetical protein